jgi:cation transport protein ChaC
MHTTAETVAETVWLFGYGSLIYKVDFPYLERRPACIRGWARRFWQGSHDHRGTPEAPGRVVTLIAAAGEVCRGMAYRISTDVFVHLDHREKNGYTRQRIALGFDDGSEADGVVYVADPANEAFLGETSEAEIADQIAVSHGPSGANRDYALGLAAALRELGGLDAHVAAIERHLLQAQPAPVVTL